MIVKLHICGGFSINIVHENVSAFLFYVKLLHNIKEKLLPLLNAI